MFLLIYDKYLEPEPFPELIELTNCRRTPIYASLAPPVIITTGADGFGGFFQVLEDQPM